MPCNIWQLTIILVVISKTCFADVALNISALSSPRAGFSAIEAGSKVYFIGGFEHGDLRATKTIEVYDLLTQNMSTPLQLDTPRAYVTPIVIEPNIYFVGGLQYDNPTLVYDPVPHEFTNYGTGPTVLNTKEISLHNSLLTIVGTNGVDILDVENGVWLDPLPLRDLLSVVAQSAIFGSEGLVMVLGGVNVTTGAYSSSVWVYNISSSEMHEYPDMLAAPFTQSGTRSFVSGGVIAIQCTEYNQGVVLVYHVARRLWQIVSLENPSAVISLPDVTFIFNDTATLVTVYWNGTRSTTRSIGMTFAHAFIVNNIAVYLAKPVGVASMAFTIYDQTRDVWVATTPFSTTQVVRSVTLATWHVIQTPSNVLFGYNPSLKRLLAVVDAEISFGPILSIISAEDPDQMYIFEDGKVTKTQFFSNGTANSLIKQQPCAIVPLARVGSEFFNVQGQVMNLNSWTQATNHTVPQLGQVLYDSNDQGFVLTNVPVLDLAKVDYNRVDIYNYVTKQWANSTVMPEELTTSTTVRWFYSAAALDNKLVVWMNTVMAVYDPTTSNWTTYTNYTQSTVNNAKSDIHIPVPTAQGLAFMRTDNNTLDVFSPSTFPAWTSTSPAPQVEQSSKYVFQQCIVRNNSQLFITSISISSADALYNTLYIYDVLTGKWTYDQLPNGLTATAVPIIVFAGDFLLSMTNGILSYLNLISRDGQDQILPFKFSPAIALETSANVTFIAGGINQYGSYSDRIMIIPHNTITINPPNSNVPTVQPSAHADSSLSEGELIATIVVPIGAVLIGTILLVFFLVRRNKRRRRQGSSNTVGLAGKYGQWFIPFESIKFGDQLGQGASGQVFKGTWRGTTVALKVSMTQAHSSVISELELMMQLRPHPNVIQLFGFSVHPETDSIILVIEYCNGGSLDDTLFTAKQHISLQQKISWLVGMAKGVEHLHANNIVHRDIAARNVLLHQNEPKITDFGMSRLIDEDNQRGTTKSELGPIRWMSPESLKNKEYSNKSGTLLVSHPSMLTVPHADVWSFGILMNEVIAQVEPHAEADPIEIGRLIRDNGLTPSVPSSCPSELAQLMKQCWDMTPYKRVSIEQIELRLEAMQRT